MKIAITADLQFDLHSKNSYPDSRTGLTSRFADQLDCFEWVVKAALKRDCEMLVILGDIFDSRTEIDIGVLHHVCRTIEEAARKLTVHILAGNHDSRLRTPELNSLQVFNGLAHVHDHLDIVPVGDVDLCFVPWYDDPEGVKQGVQTVLNRSNKKRRKWLFSHCMLQSIYPDGKGVPLAWLRPAKFEYVFLGDVHDPIEISETVRYCGCPMHIDYRDAGRRAGFYIVGTDDNHFEWCENEISPRFHISDGSDTMSLEIKDGDFVRVKTDDPEVAEEALKNLHEQTSNVETTFVEPDDTPPRLDVHASDTHAEVLKRYCEHEEIDNDHMEEVVKVGLEILEEARIE